MWLMCIIIYEYIYNTYNELNKKREKQKTKHEMNRKLLYGKSVIQLHIRCEFTIRY